MAMCMVYKKGTAYRLREGWVDHKIILRADMAEANQEGWFANPLDLFKPAEEVPTPPPSDRMELMRKAQELGIEFNKRISTKSLRARIEAGTQNELDEGGDS